jgi:hypothetical protein
VKARYVTVKVVRAQWLHFSQVAVYASDGDGSNLAAGKAASCFGERRGGEQPGFKTSLASYAVDGVLRPRGYGSPNDDTVGIYHSLESSADNYWTVDLGGEFAVNRVVFYNRRDGGGNVEGRAMDYILQLSDGDKITVWQTPLRRDSVQTFAVSVSGPSAPVDNPAPSPPPIMHQVINHSVRNLTAPAGIHKLAAHAERNPHRVRTRNDTPPPPFIS